MKTIKHFPAARYPFAIVDEHGAVSSAYRKESDAQAALEHVNEGERNDANDAKLAGLPVYGDPVACPFCRGSNILFVTGWTGMTSEEDPANRVDLDEYQCLDCDGRSFWA